MSQWLEQALRNPLSSFLCPLENLQFCHSEFKPLVSFYLWPCTAKGRDEGTVSPGSSAQVMLFFPPPPVGLSHLSRPSTDAIHRNLQRVLSHTSMLWAKDARTMKVASRAQIAHYCLWEAGGDIRNCNVGQKGWKWMPAPECSKALAMEMMMALDYLLPVSPGIQFLHPQCSPGTLNDTYRNIHLDHLWRSVHFLICLRPFCRHLYD